MDNQSDKRTWKERLEGIPPQQTISGVLRGLHLLGIKISDKGLRNQHDKHGILSQDNGWYSIRVDTVLSLKLWRDNNGNQVTDDRQTNSSAVARYALARAIKTEAEARMREREDALAEGELIHKDHLSKLVLSPAIKFQRGVLSGIDKKAEALVDMVGGDQGKAHAVARDIRLWIKDELAKAYAGNQYVLSIDPVRKATRQESLIDE